MNQELKPFLVIDYANPVQEFKSESLVGVNIDTESGWSFYGVTSLYTTIEDDCLVIDFQKGDDLIANYAIRNFVAEKKQVVLYQERLYSYRLKEE